MTLLPLVYIHRTNYTIRKHCLFGDGVRGIKVSDLARLGVYTSRGCTLARMVYIHSNMTTTNKGYKVLLMKRKVTIARVAKVAHEIMAHCEAQGFTAQECALASALACGALAPDRPALKDCVGLLRDTYRARK